MDAELLARIQFAFTVGFHFIFPPLTIGMAWIIFLLMTRYKRTRSEFDGRVARFWFKIFALSFAVGVATGITMEFQFGTNWSEYSRYVGDIFGAPLAAEGIFAFFLESAFMGVLLFGWNRFSIGVKWFSSLMVAVGSTLSAFWIIVANWWQQTPRGYEIVNGRAELTDFWAAVFNPSTLPRYLHTIDSALITGSFFVMGISGWYILKRRNLEFAKTSAKAALVIGLVASTAQIFIGHYHAVQVSETQPAKLAAVEGVFETQTRAPALIFGIPNAEEGRMDYEIGIPGVLSFMAFGDVNAEVKGLNDMPRDEWPPLLLTFASFHTMVGLGMFFILFWLVGVFLLKKKKLFENRLYFRLALLAIPLPFIACELGWIAAEVGRQPWVVYGELRTKDAISVTVPAWQILTSLIMFIVVYSGLFALWIYALRRKIIKGPETGDGPADGTGKEVTA